MTEKILKTRKTGMLALISFIFLYLLAIVLVIFGAVEAPPLMLLGILWLCIGWIPFLGLKVLKPQEALVLTPFGKYVGTILFCQSVLYCSEPCGGYQTGSER